MDSEQKWWIEWKMDHLWFMTNLSAIHRDRSTFDSNSIESFDSANFEDELSNICSWRDCGSVHLWSGRPELAMTLRRVFFERRRWRVSLANRYGWLTGILRTTPGTSISCPPSIINLFTQNWVCNKRAGTIEWKMNVLPLDRPLADEQTIPKRCHNGRWTDSHEFPKQNKKNDFDWHHTGPSRLEWEHSRNIRISFGSDLLLELRFNQNICAIFHRQSLCGEKENKNKKKTSNNIEQRVSSKPASPAARTLRQTDELLI